jgi:hypothetical protein
LTETEDKQELLSLGSDGGGMKLSLEVAQRLKFIGCVAPLGRALLGSRVANEVSIQDTA